MAGRETEPHKGTGFARADHEEAGAWLAQWDADQEAEILSVFDWYRETKQKSEYDMGTISKKNIRKLYGETLNLSASQIDRQAECRLSYFLKYGLRAKERKEAVVDPAEFGTYVHAVLENTAKCIRDLGGFSVVTLEETLDADLLVHVIDVSHALYKEQSEAVYRVLEEIGAQDKPVLSVFNKIDKLPEDSGLLNQLKAIPDSVCISAKKQIGLNELLATITDHLKMKSVEVTMLIPYSDSGIAAKLFESGTVLSQDYQAEGIKMVVRVQANEIGRWEKFIVNR
jgi:hypothetical protein